MAFKCSCCSPRVVVIGLAVFTYFILYPGDIETLLAPFTAFGVVLQDFLNVTTAVSPWLYATVAVCFVACSVTRIWGKAG